MHLSTLGWEESIKLTSYVLLEKFHKAPTIFVRIITNFVASEAKNYSEIIQGLLKVVNPFGGYLK